MSDSTDFGNANAATKAPDNTSLAVLDNGLYPFDREPFVELKDGTKFKFRLPTKEDEQRREDRMKTVITTLPGRINGQNPKQTTTDYSRSELGYFDDLIEEVTGFALVEGDDPATTLQANLVVGNEYSDKLKRQAEVTVGDKVPTKHKRAAAARIYGGRIDVEKPDERDPDNEVEGDEKPQQVLVIRSQRFITVLFKAGVEQQDDGTFSEPTHVVKYVFKEPQSRHLSAWETKCFNGQTINLNKGGTREERTFNLTAVENLFDSLIEKVEGASLDNAEIDVRIPEHKARIPLSQKKNTLALCMGEVMGDVGN